MILFFSGGNIDWAAKIEGGIKIHTARTAKRQIRSGARLQLAVDRFRPTRRVVLDTICVSTQELTISGLDVSIDGIRIESLQKKELAVNGGFESVEQMLDYYGDSYSGTIIHWTKKKY